MLNPSLLPLFLLASILLILTPGPDMMYLMARSLQQGRSAGIVSALGIGTGILVHTLAAAIGLSALVMSSAIAYTALKWIGAVYLIYMGVQAFLSSNHPSSSADLPAVRSQTLFVQGMLTDVLNPKAALFFLAFLPQFVDPDRGNVAAQLLVLGLVYAVLGLVWHMILACAIGSTGDWLKRRPVFSKIQRWFTGTVLISLGIRVALPERP